MAQPMVHQCSYFNCDQHLHLGPHPQDSHWMATLQHLLCSFVCTDAPMAGTVHTSSTLQADFQLVYTNPYLLGLHCLLHLPHEADIHSITILGMRPDLHWSQTGCQTASMVHTLIALEWWAVHFQCSTASVQRSASESCLCCANRWQVFAPARRVHRDLQASQFGDAYFLAPASPAALH